MPKLYLNPREQTNKKWKQREGLERVRDGHRGPTNVHRNFCSTKTYFLKIGQLLRLCKCQKAFSFMGTLSLTRGSAPRPRYRFTVTMCLPNSGVNISVRQDGAGLYQHL